MSRGSSALRQADAAPVFAALGDATRLRLISRLCDDGPLSISRLTEGERVTRQAVTKHLELLADAGVVASSREGRERIWELRPKRLQMARTYLELVSGQWDAAIQRLESYLDEHP